jgi:hypothetical protein
MIPPRDAKPFKEMAFPESAKANARVLVNLLAEHFAATSITGTHREQTLHLKEPASLVVVLRRTGVSFVLSEDSASETDEVIDTIDAIEAVLKGALGLAVEEELPFEDNAAPDHSEEISKAIVRCLMELNSAARASRRSRTASWSAAASPSFTPPTRTSPRSSTCAFGGSGLLAPREESRGEFD